MGELEVVAWRVVALEGGKTIGKPSIHEDGEWAARLPSLYRAEPLTPLAPAQAEIARLRQELEAYREGEKAINARVQNLNDLRHAAEARALAAEERVRVLEGALSDLVKACRAADADGDLSEHVDGSLLDAADDALYPAIWTEEQVRTLEARQANGMMHPYTCGNDRSDALHLEQAEEDGEEGQPGKLIPTRQGWVCPACDYRQFWSHETGGVSALLPRQPGATDE